MRVIKTIARDKLREFYGGDMIPMLEYGLRVERMRPTLITALPEISTLYADGIISIQRSINTSKLEAYGVSELMGMTDYRFLLLPADLINSVELPSPIECAEEVLKVLMPGRYVVDKYQDLTGSYGKIYLHYPELEIKNGHGLSHTIRDLIVELIFDVDAMEAGFRGMRSTLTSHEAIAGYAHSHLPTGEETGFTGFQYFCLGSNGIQTWLNNNCRTIDQDKFAMFLFQLEAYLKWESLEGMPYISIATVGINSSASPEAEVSSAIAVAEIEDFAVRMMKNLDPKWLMPIPGTKDFYLNYGAVAKELFELELKLYEETPPSNLLTNAYNVDFGLYVNSIDDDGDIPDGMCSDEDAQVVLGHFNITPKLIPVEKQDSSRLIRRYVPNVLFQIFELINQKLLDSNIINEKNRVVAESENHHQAELSSAN